MASWFAGLAWWCYGITAVLAVAFGLAQVWLLKCALLGKDPKRWLLPVKLALWVGALIGMALWSPGLLLVFALLATGALMAGAAVLYFRIKKEAR